MSLLRRAGLVALGILVAGAARAQLRLPEPAPDADGWLSMYRSGFGEWKIEPDSLDLRPEGLAYRIHTGSYFPPVWVTARCNTGERAEIAKTLDWRRPAHGTWAELDVLFACSLARQRGMDVDRVEAWGEEEVSAVVDAWSYSAGTASYDWRVAYFASEADAHEALLEPWGDGTDHLAPTRHASSLLDVPPSLRRPLRALWIPGQRSPVLALRGVQGEPEWAIVEFVASGPLEKPGDARDFHRRAARWVGAGHLEAPAALLVSPRHLAQAAYRGARTPADLGAIDTPVSPDFHFADDLTPLTLAVLLGNEALARALLGRGADPNLCGVAGCPLHAVSLQEQAATRPAWVDLLLRAGAKPDAFDNNFDMSESTALGSAAYAGDQDLAARLLAGGAHPDGAPGVRHPPIELALGAGRRDMAQWLIDKGASVLPLPDRGMRDPARGGTGQGNAWRAARQTGDESLLAWVEARMLQAAQASPRHTVAASVEQDGKQQPLVDGRTVRLRAAPFRLVFTFGADDAPGVVLGSSFAPAFAAVARRQERHNGLLIPSRSSDLAIAPDPASFELYAYDPPAASHPAGKPWGGHMLLSPDATARRDADAKQGRESVREVRAVRRVPERGSPPAVEIGNLKGRNLTLVFGSTLQLDPVEWAPWVKPQAVTLAFH